MRALIVAAIAGCAIPQPTFVGNHRVMPSRQAGRERHRLVRSDSRAKHRVRIHVTPTTSPGTRARRAPPQSCTPRHEHLFAPGSFVRARERRRHARIELLQFVPAFPAVVRLPLDLLEAADRHPAGIRDDARNDHPCRAGPGLLTDDSRTTVSLGESNTGTLEHRTVHADAAARDTESPAAPREACGQRRFQFDWVADLRERRAAALPSGVGANRGDRQQRRPVRLAPATPPCLRRAPPEGR